MRSVQTKTGLGMGGHIYPEDMNSVDCCIRAELDCIYCALRRVGILFLYIVLKK
jgi:hypothetical protein